VQQIICSTELPPLRGDPGSAAVVAVV